jgi:hypothetical protein
MCLPSLSQQSNDYRGELLCSIDGDKWRMQQAFHFDIGERDAEQQGSHRGFNLYIDQYKILRRKLLSSEADQIRV